MNRGDSVGQTWWRAGRAPWWVLGAALLGLVGCMHQQQARLQSDEENERDRYGVETVGDKTVVGNAEPVPLGGVGLVVGLEGTGGGTANDGNRAMLEDELRKEGVRNIKEVLASSNHALVIVQAQLPPGARKGDPIDVEVSLPPGSRATSLRGGYLRSCQLFNYDFARHLNPDYKGPADLLRGHPLAQAEGMILTGLGDGDEAARVKRGRIWGGGRCKTDQPFALVMNPDQQYARVANVIANRVNDAFPGGNVATARDRLAVSLRVPPAYHLNQPRYLRVVRLIPLAPVEDAPAPGKEDRRSYRQRLTDDLLDPAHTVVAALRLEALGQKSIPTLKQGLESKHPLVRFCCAESLAYLGSPACGDELARAVVEQPLLRAFGLTALASLDEAISQIKLRELLTTSTDDVIRYGAFRALRALDERNPAVQGELLNDSFWLHQVAPETAPLVHVSSTRRAEIVLFGEEPCLKPPFSFLAGEFAVTATEDDPRCTISRFPLHGSSARKQCSLKLADVLRTMAEMGGMYPEAVTLLQQANACQSLNCRVRSDALPQATSVYDLVRIGRSKSGSAEGAELLAGQDLGATPTLYEVGLPSQSALVREQEAAQRDHNDRPVRKPGARPHDEQE